MKRRTNNLGYICTCIDDIGCVPTDDLYALRHLASIDRSTLKNLHGSAAQYESVAGAMRPIPATMLAAIRDIRNVDTTATQK